MPAAGAASSGAPISRRRSSTSITSRTIAICWRWTSRRWHAVSGLPAGRPVERPAVPRLHEQPPRRMLRTARPARRGRARRGKTRASVGVLAPGRASVRREPRLPSRRPVVRPPEPGRRPRRSPRNTSRGAFDLSHLRGNSSLAPAAQAADYFVRGQAGPARDRRSDSREPRADGAEAAATLRNGDTRFRVRVRGTDADPPRAVSCREDKLERPVVWSLVALEGEPRAV